MTRLVTAEAAAESSSNVGSYSSSALHNDPRRWFVLAAVCFALTSIVLDNTILNVALPSIEQDLEAGPAELQAIINAQTGPPDWW